MNHILVSLLDYYNSIFIERVPYKHKNWQLHGILIIPVQISLFSPHMQKVDFQLKNVKNNHFSTSDLLEYTKSCTKKRHAPSFSKICTVHENKSKQRIYQKILNQNLDQ